MSGKRKASGDALGSPRPPPARRGAGNDDEHSSHGGDSRGDRTYSADSEHSPLRGDHVGGADSDEQESGVALRATNALFRFNYRPYHRLSAEWRPSNWKELVAAEAQEHLPPPNDQHAEEEEVQPPPPADQSAAVEVADQSVAAAAPAPEMVVPAADSVRCTGCWREPASVRPVPVENACFCPHCRSDGLYCVFCDAPSR